MTGKERAAQMYKRKAMEKSRVFGVIILEVIFTLALLCGGVALEGSLGSTLLIAGSVMLAFNYVALLWNVLTRLVSGGIRSRSKGLFIMSVILSIILTSATVYVFSLMAG